MSISPAQNFSKPPPVPDSPTVILTSGFSCWNCSAAAWASGKTVLEPSTAMVAGHLLAALGAAGAFLAATAGGHCACQQSARGGDGDESG